MKEKEEFFIKVMKKIWESFNKNLHKFYNYRKRSSRSRKNIKKIYIMKKYYIIKEINNI